MEDFGNGKEKWLRKYLELPKGIPSHDTFDRVLSAINPAEFNNCFMDWVNALHEKISSRSLY